MSDYETQIQSWRLEMTQAGVTRPEVLDELEGHLRERTNWFVRLGASEEEAFRDAVRELGESRVLKQEFCKLNRHWFSGYRDNPIALKILATWFVVMGLTGFLQRHPAQSFASMDGLLRLDSPLQLLIGLGLLHRRNAWRYCAFGWAASNVILYAYALTPAPLNFVYSQIEKHPLSDTPLLNAQAHYNLWLGLPGPPSSIPTVHLLGLVVTIGALAWACAVLASPAVRNLFAGR